MSLGSIHDQPGSLYGAQALDFFKELFDKDAGNKICVDCGAHNPLWASLSYGTYFCLECSGVHRNLGVHISFVRSLNMDSWSLQQQAKMRLGGNTALQRYLRAAGMPEEYNRNGSPQSIRDKYQSNAAEAYRDHLGKVGRGEASGPPPQVPFEVAVVQQRDTKQVSGFGSAPPPASASSFDGMGGLDSLMSGLGSLGSKTVNLTSKVAAVAAPRLSNFKDSVKSVAVLAAEKASTIGGPPDASALSLAHLRAGRGDGGRGVQRGCRGPVAAAPHEQHHRPHAGRGSRHAPSVASGASDSSLERCRPLCMFTCGVTSRDPDQPQHSRGMPGNPCSTAASSAP